MQTNSVCQIVSVGKRRDGGTKYWCLSHHADATAKYGKPGERCRYAHISPPSAEESLHLNCSDFPGGVALWGAVPPIYDTTCLPVDHGIHVHARLAVNGDKQIDKTFRHVTIQTQSKSEGIVLNELDAIYYMVSSVLNREMSVITCTKCGYCHLDKDWFSVHPHQKHLCSGCGRNFTDNKVGIGNPLIAVRDLFDEGKPRVCVTPKRHLEIRQKDYPGGIQIWGSNPAIVWKSTKDEECGIHVHAFISQQPEDYAIDNTFDSVTIDGMYLNPAQVRTLMAQNALPHLKDRVQSLLCPYCKQLHFDTDELAYTPHKTHLCEWCGREFEATGKLRSTIGNPLVSMLKKLESLSHRPAQHHDIGLLSETI